MSALAITVEPREKPGCWAQWALPARVTATIVGLPARVLLIAIRLYQRFLSPVLPVVTLGACACRFAPTCSEYAAEAVRVHGAGTGAWLVVRRLIKCTPLHPGGIDPVPPRRMPVCRAAARSPLS